MLNFKSYIMSVWFRWIDKKNSSPTPSYKGKGLNTQLVKKLVLIAAGRIDITIYRDFFLIFLSFRSFN